MTAIDDTDAVRIDAWLWRARFFKTRADACRFVETGRVRLAREAQTLRVTRPSLKVRLGDVLTFAKAGQCHVIRIDRLLDKRVGPPLARQAYAPLEDVA